MAAKGSVPTMMKGVFPCAELDVEQNQDNKHADRNMIASRFCSLRRLSNCSSPGVVVAGGEFSPFRSSAAGGPESRWRGSRASYAELDWNVAPSALVIDHEGAVSQAYVGHCAKRHLVAFGSGDEDFSDGVRSVAELRPVANREVEAPVAINDLGDWRAADRGLHDIGSHPEAEARSALPLVRSIEDQQAGLTGHVEDPRRR